jgi:hypothetical protein
VVRAIDYIDYRLQNIKDAEPVYRLITTILDPGRPRPNELAGLLP